MGMNSKIDWCDATFNPWVGCQKVSAGCKNCYAERDFDKRRHFAQWGPNGTRVLTSQANWRAPLKWNREAGAEGVRKRVFCGSLCDVFEDWLGEMTDPGHGIVRMAAARALLFDLIDVTPNLDWLLLTKRPENIARMMPAYMPNYIAEAGTMNQEEIRPNVWIGTSVEDQTAADQRIPELLKIPAAVRFLSCEPLLGPINFNEAFLSLDVQQPASCQCGHGHGFTRCANYGGIAQKCHITTCDCNGFRKRIAPETGIHWVIAGGESGHNARPSHHDWFRGLRDQCQAAGVPFFFKNWGEWAPIVDTVDRFYGHTPSSAPLARNRAYVKALGKMLRHHQATRIVADRPEGWQSHEIRDGECGPSGEPQLFMGRVGKVRAGRLLDGREWNEVPT